MYLLIGFLVVAFAFSCWIGYQRIFRMQHLNQRRLANGLIIAMIVFTILSTAHGLGYFPQPIAAKFTMGLYSMATGFFSGFACRMITLRRSAKVIEYAYRSFWTEAAPTMIAILLIAFGIYRTGLFTLGPYTGIGITSGLSLLGFGFWGLTMSVVPEFRFHGILIVDQLVSWKQIVAYEWKSENVIQIDYFTSDNELTDFTTFIPGEDQLIIERLLGKKLKEHEQERKEQMQQTG